MASIRDEMGRNDPDLTPAHDKVMLWLDGYVKNEIGENLRELHWEYPLDNNRLFIDMVAFARQDWRLTVYAYEVKPKLYSIGSAIRQLKIYYQELESIIMKKYYTDSKIVKPKIILVLVSPSINEFESILSNEGINTLTIPKNILYSAGVVKEPMPF